ncbi:hypothetical protein [Alicyclobacillus sp. ALC3]|uniref:hypothetical protein n=1 Tax=Alicyclobacillus sp. ALC3 TaxID=2796143 RepID=UPI002378C7B9|nr:hypothetical protein [Alicyclobacillus sp. ALC3]WDL98492.1 hypothetical protein JC200_07375 [Alicyclobacillus sp. ALC3]
MDIRVDGLDDMRRELDDLSRKAQQLDGEQTVSFAELFPPEFVQRHSALNNMQELVEKSGFPIETQEDFTSIPNEKWDEYIRASTDFSDWETMWGEAAKQYTIRSLGL